MVQDIAAEEKPQAVMRALKYIYGKAWFKEKMCMGASKQKGVMQEGLRPWIQYWSFDFSVGTRHWLDTGNRFALLK